MANELGIEISQINRIERGVINTSVTPLYAISKVLNIDISELFFLINSPNLSSPTNLIPNFLFSLRFSLKPVFFYVNLERI